MNTYKKEGNALQEQFPFRYLIFNKTWETNVSFEDFAKTEGLSLMLWESDVYASSDTALANRAFKAGKQSLQKELDDLKSQLLKVVDSYTRGSDTDDMGTDIKEILK